MERATYIVTAEVWLHPGAAGWHFVTVPDEVADEIQARFAGAHRPFGSLPVQVVLGATTFTTSLFRDTRSASYLLPIKTPVRRREGIRAGDEVSLTIRVVHGLDPESPSLS